MESLSCDLKIPEIPQIENADLTVGRHFQLICQRPITNSEIQFKNLHLMVNPDLKYNLKLMKVDSSTDSHLAFDFVSYVAGEYKNLQLILSDDVNQWQLQVPSFQVKSVLTEEQKQKIKTGEEVPSFGFKLLSPHWPLEMTLGLAGSFLFVLFVIIWLDRKRQKMKMILNNMIRLDSVTDPETQFYKKIRRIEKNEYPAQEFLQIYKVFLTRTFQVPFTELKEKEALNYFKKRWPTLINERKEIKNSLDSLQRGLKELPEKRLNRSEVELFFKSVDRLQKSFQQNSHKVVE